jgi:hypothetical protein
MMKNIFFNIKEFIFTISSLSNFLSNSSHSSSTIPPFYMNSIKVDSILHLTLGSLGQFWLTKINLSKVSDCNQHLLRLVKIPTKQKMHLISIWELTIPKICFTRNLTTRNLDSCFSHHWSYKIKIK